MTSAFRSGELWGDGSGVAAALTTSYVAAAGGAVLVDHQCDLVCLASLPGDPCASVELEVQGSLDGSTFAALPHEYIDALGQRQARDGVIVRSGIVTAHLFVVRVPHEMWVRFRAKRTAGTVDTTLLLTGEAREARGADMGAEGGGGSGLSSYSDRQLAWANGSQAALAMGAGTWTDSSETDIWFPSGEACRGSIDVAYTVTGAVTDINARILKRKSASVATEYAQQATNSVVGGVEDTDDHVLDLPVTTGNRSFFFPVEPGYEYKVQFQRTAGTSVTALAYINFTR